MINSHDARICAHIARNRGIRLVLRVINVEAIIPDCVQPNNQMQLIIPHTSHNEMW